MRRALLTLLFLLAACSTDESPSTPPTAEDMSRPDMAAPDIAPELDHAADLAEPDLAPACTCSEVSVCCDGCMPLTGSCGDACAPGSECQDGVCRDGMHIDCSVEDECKQGYCDPDQGCVVEDLADGVRCGGNAGTCQSGQCVPDPDCECRDDAGPCCKGCRFVAKDTVCQENWVVATCGPPEVDQISVADDQGDLLCTGQTAKCERLPDNSNFDVIVATARVCGSPDVATCTPGEGELYEGCGLKK